MNSDNAASETPSYQQRASSGFGHVLTTFSRWWARDVSGTVKQSEVIAKRRAECQLSARYLLMISMSAGIAVLGLLQGSAAVVIGAMLLSPLMDPIMGIGFALAVGDFKWLKQSLRSLLIGSLFAVLFCALIVFLSPIQTITGEIAARTRPNLFDLGVAFFSAVAGAYAMIRGREGTIVGVAIATALMPPLAVVGFGLATLNWTVFSGSLLLFITNLTAIALTATAMARIYGFGSSLSEKQTQLQGLLIFAAFVALAIPLGLSLRQIVWETNASRQMNSVVEQVFGGNARVSDLVPNYQTDPIQVSATVLTPEIIGDAERRTITAISRALGRPVEVQLTQVRVGTRAQAAQEAQLAKARDQEAAAQESAENLAMRLALVAGVPEGEVLIDRQRRAAIVRAVELEGASLETYYALEQRIAAGQEGWRIEVQPPGGSLPAIAYRERVLERADIGAPRETVIEPSAAGTRALSLAIWAAQRKGRALDIAGPADLVALARADIERAGVKIGEVTTSGDGDRVTLRWSTAD